MKTVYIVLLIRDLFANHHMALQPKLQPTFWPFNNTKVDVFVFWKQTLVPHPSSKRPMQQDMVSVGMECLPSMGLHGF